MAALHIAGLTKRFGARTVLDDIHLQLPAGTLTAILGPSGGGKTTLLRLICGFERADGGEIRIGDTPVSAPGVFVPTERRHIGYVAQEGALFPHLTVAQNIVFGLPRQQRAARHRVPELLALVGLSATFADRLPHQLSGGEQQRVALARALAPSPALVLLDEPFSALDAGLRADTRQAVSAALAATGATALLVTHDQAEALSMGHQVAVLWGGKMAQISTPQALYRYPQSQAIAEFVGKAVWLDALLEPAGARTALGLLPVQGTQTAGPARVLLRPEQIRLVTNGHDMASVRGIEYLGAHAALSLVLHQTGEALSVLVNAQDIPQPGSRFALKVEGPVTVFDQAGQLLANQDSALAA
ncbi:iron(III) transport system ATP-binding protein [Silvimonas terrae]|uniref:Iron(III) transport system ATP-binding protein n=1 Tax=Silvimonas terrae TaxID=300266 RepID=A0A840REX3_9NEIS|nr:ABC transporter ATP-binding protein [Silvimonas terrae]MBB5190893.1 iron(III) transport system ATP-binding protein [Silvimonas terrae]